MSGNESSSSLDERCCIILFVSLPRFTPRQIDACIAAAELSNFTLAARRLTLTPSAISSLITELEAQLGFALFERTTRKVALTAAGRDFLPSAIAVQRQMSRAAFAAVDIRDRATDVVRVAAPMAVAAMLLPPVVAAYRGVDARTSVRIVDTGVEWLADRVAIGEADLALGPGRSVSADVTCVPLFTTDWVVWLAPAHPLATGEMLRWGDLHGEQLFAAGRDHEHSVRPLLDEGSGAFARLPVQIVENLSTALGLAAAGLGITFSPQYVEPFAQAFGVVSRRLVDPVITRTLSLYRPAARGPSRAASAFADHLLDRLRRP